MIEDCADKVFSILESITSPRVEKDDCKAPIWARWADKLLIALSNSADVACAAAGVDKAVALPPTPGVKPSPVEDALTVVKSALITSVTDVPA